MTIVEYGVSPRHASKPLTVKTLENLKPGIAWREVPDGLLRGLYFSSLPARRAGPIATGTAARDANIPSAPYPAIDLKRARELARAAAGRIAEGHDPAADK